MVISILLKIGIVKFLNNLHTALIVKKQIFLIKILNEINFFKILIYILNYLKMLFSLKIYVIHWYSQCIATGLLNSIMHQDILRSSLVLHQLRYYTGILHIRGRWLYLPQEIDIFG